MAKSDKSRTQRHHSGHSSMKKNCSRKMRRIAKQALYMGEEPVVKMAGLARPFQCCGNHLSDWRY